jgi:hypothetical protein
MLQLDTILSASSKYVADNAFNFIEIILMSMDSRVSDVNGYGMND